MASLSVLGSTKSGEQVVAGRISAHGLTATILNWGATLQDLRLKSSGHPLVLGFTSFDDYLEHGMYHGATVGRVVNRIGGASTMIGSTLCHFDGNAAGGHMLHGGGDGYAMRVWQIMNHQDSEITLGLTDPSGHMGFPGTVAASCRYSLVTRRGAPTLRVELTAKTDAPALVNLGHHSYFCLDDSGDIRGHQLRIDAARYLPADADSLPTGDIQPVDATPFDFRMLRPVGDSYDHNFCLAGARHPIAAVATLASSQSGLSMEVGTTEPGLQLYTGQELLNGGDCHAGHATGRFAGICLEAQAWPDAPNNPSFPRLTCFPVTGTTRQPNFPFSNVENGLSSGLHKPKRAFP